MSQEKKKKTSKTKLENITKESSQDSSIEINSQGDPEPPKKKKKNVIDFTLGTVNVKKKKDTPITLAIHSTLEYLRKNRKEFTIQNIIEELKLDTGIQSKLIENLKNHSKIQHRIVGSTVYFEYNPIYKVRNQTGILEVLEKHLDGIPYEDLKDSYENSEEDMKQLEELGKIFIANYQSKRSAPTKTVFRGIPTEFNLVLDNEIRKKWESLVLPKGDDVISEIEEFKDKTWKSFKTIHKSFKTERKLEEKEKKKKKLTKETNSHLKGVFDFSEIWKSKFGPDKKKKV